MKALSCDCFNILCRNLLDWPNYTSARLSRRQGQFNIWLPQLNLQPNKPNFFCKIPSENKSTFLSLFWYTQWAGSCTTQIFPKQFTFSLQFTFSSCNSLNCTWSGPKYYTIYLLEPPNYTSAHLSRRQGQLDIWLPQGCGHLWSHWPHIVLHLGNLTPYLNENTHCLAGFCIVLR